MFVIHVSVFIFLFVYLMNYFMNSFVRSGTSTSILKVEHIKPIKHKFTAFFLKKRLFNVYEPKHITTKELYLLLNFKNFIISGI